MLKATIVAASLVSLWIPLPAKSQEEPEWVAKIEAETNSYLGPENAVLCKEGDTSCAKPIIVSVMCDASQFFSCRTIARAVRFSRKLYLIYPFRTTREEQLLTPDIILVYRYEPEYRSHTIDILPQKEDGIFSKNRRESRISGNLEHLYIPDYIISAPLDGVQSTAEKIENRIKSLETK